MKNTEANKTEKVKEPKLTVADKLVIKHAGIKRARYLTLLLRPFNRNITALRTTLSKIDLFEYDVTKQKFEQDDAYYYKRVSKEMINLTSQIENFKDEIDSIKETMRYEMRDGEHREAYLKMKRNNKNDKQKFIAVAVAISNYYKENKSSSLALSKLFK